MPKYATPGFNSVHAEDFKSAAETFAARQARKTYGRRGIVRVLRFAGWSENKKQEDYEAFIGTQNKNGDTDGHNIFVYVTRIDNNSQTR